MPKILYKSYLKPLARQLRSNMTDSELLLWSRIRRRQILDIQFYRQRSIGNYIIDFFAPRVRLVIELDGGQHFDEEYIKKDQIRDAYLKNLGLRVLRFDNDQVMRSLEEVLEEIYRTIQAQEIPPNPPFTKWGT